MTCQRFVAVVWSGTGDQDRGGKRSCALRNSERSGQRDVRRSIGKGHFLFTIRVRLHRGLRAADFQRLVGTFEFHFLLGASLRPVTDDGIFCGIKRTLENSGDRRDFEMEGIILLQ